MSLPNKRLSDSRPKDEQTEDEQLIDNPSAWVVVVGLGVVFVSVAVSLGAVAYAIYRIVSALL